MDANKHKFMYDQIVKLTNKLAKMTELAEEILSTNYFYTAHEHAEKVKEIQQILEED